MAYSNEVVARARARLAQAKADRESENNAHLRIAYARVPRLREIDRALRLTMAQAAQSIFDPERDAQSALTQARKENEALQREREWLIDANFEEGFLDDSPICEKCGGQGYLGSQMCECLAELCRQEQKKELSVLSGASRESFETFRLSYYSDQPDGTLGASPRAIMAATLNTCQRFARHFSMQSGNLLLSGGTGLGKTFLSACIARTVADNGFSVAYETAGQLFARLEAAKFEDDPEAKRLTAAYRGCDLLILDDLGTEMVTQFTISALYMLVNDRLLAGIPTVISTNLNTTHIGKRYSPQIASRLLGAYRRVPFVGEDVRLQKARGI